MINFDLTIIVSLTDFPRIPPRPSLIHLFQDYMHMNTGPEPNNRLYIIQAAAFDPSAPIFVLSLFRLIHEALSTLSRSLGGQLLP